VRRFLPAPAQPPPRHDHSHYHGGSVYVTGDLRATPHPPPSQSIYSSEYTDISSVVFSPPGPPSEPATHTPVIHTPTNGMTRSSGTLLLVYKANDTAGGVSSTNGREARGRYVGGLFATLLEGEEHGEDGDSRRSGVRQSPVFESDFYHRASGWRHGTAVVCCPESSGDSSCYIPKIKWHYR
jgi:hypothetical protein